MLIIFFTIVFIAELIVIAKIISLLKKANNTICEINSQLKEVKPLIKKGIADAKNGVSGITSGIGGFSKFIDKKKKDILKILLKGGIVLIVFIAFKKFPNKRILTAFDWAFTLGKLFKIV